MIKTTITKEQKLSDKSFSFTVIHDINTSYSRSLYPFITKTFKRLAEELDMPMAKYLEEWKEHKELEHLNIYAKTITFTFSN